MNRRNRAILSTTVIFIGSVVVSFVIGEILVRISGHYDVDGNFFLGSRRLKPYIFPVKNVSRKIQEYLILNNSYQIVYDSFLGWTNKPGSLSKDGLYYINSDGIRTATQHTLISKVPKQGVLRIAIFGDSYTHSSDVPFENTWGYYLESNLRKQGVNAEVLNFGVGAYGMDQAFLRWLKIGRSFSPDIVIFGFCGQNVERNVYLIKAFLYPERSSPYTKPRFILGGERLKLINVPTLPPEKVISVIKNPTSWNLIKYEFWFNPNDYKRGLLSGSKLLSLILCFADQIKNELAVNRTEQNFYSVDGEPFQLTLKIIREFRNDVELKEAKFYSVFLPWRRDLKLLSKSNSLPYSKLLTYVEKEVPMIHPEYKMLEEAKNAGLKRLFTGHYSSWGNKLVADVISDYILQQKQNAKQEKL